MANGNEEHTPAYTDNSIFSKEDRAATPTISF